MNKNLKRGLFGGFLSMVITLAGAWVLGKLSGYEAKVLLGAALPGINMLCNTVILASATILALLLTLLGITSNTGTKLKPLHYHRVKQIAYLDTVLFVVSMVVFLLLNIPIVESEEVPGTWFISIYYAALTSASMLGGILIAVVLMLFGTISDIINIVGLEAEDHPLVAVQQDIDVEEQED